MQDAPDAILHFAAAHMLNSMLRLPQAVYVLRVKPRECGCLLKYPLPLNINSLLVLF